MDRFITKTVRVNTTEELPPTKRISTPAGQRLSVVVDRGNADAPAIPSKSERRRTAKPLAGLSETTEDLPYASPYGSVDTQISALKKEDDEIYEEPKRKRWRKILIYLSIALLLILAISIGLGVGLKKNNSNGKSNGAPASAAESGSSKPGDGSPTSGSGSKPPPTNIPRPPNFPLGRYSMVTFLDTVTTECTSDAKLWTCDPGTTYNTNKQRSMTTFNWEIGGSENAYTVSSLESAPAVTFRNSPLTLFDKGGDSEHYRFQVTMDKETKPDLLLEGSPLPASCFFNSTTFQAYLYTKQGSTYPDKTISYDQPPNTLWPFRIRVEEVVSASNDIPHCYRRQLAGLGGEVSANTTARDPTQLCSCLYKNWRTMT